VTNRWQRGFTLLELMIVVLIIAVLAGIAIPAYQNYITRATRTKATRALMDLAGREERYYYSNNRYAATLSSVGYNSPYVDSNTDSRYYKVSIPAASATSYTLQADPEDVQLTKDTQCGTLTLNRAGVKDSATHDVACWSGQ
jgi:type IV pilus assembly protein PilE